MQKFLNKILLSLFTAAMIFCSASYAQDTSFTIKYDTVKIQKTKKITIVTVRTLPKFILHFNGGLNTGAMELTTHNGGFSKDTGQETVLGLILLVNFH
jgi:hypothetical protein